jgi:Glycosidases
MKERAQILNEFGLKLIAILFMPDLNTGNDYVQSRVLSYLKELVDDGADGFRFDAAKHIELPSDGNYASQFWVNTLAATRTYATTTYSRSLFAYGEILNSAGNSRHYSDYVPYFNALTDNQTGNNMMKKSRLLMSRVKIV